MSDNTQSPPFAEAFVKPEALMAVPVGLASPLWGLFAGAAVSGSAWWWMTRWARPENLEALFAATEAAPAASTPLAEPPQALEAPPAIEAVVEAPVLAEPVGGESASVAPAVAATEPSLDEEPAAKPRVRKAEPKA